MLQPGADFIGVSVSYLCHDGQGNVVLNLRGKNCRDEHGRWDCGGGKVEFGARVVDTLKREIKEEYGVEILEKTFLGFRDVHRQQNGKDTHWVTLDYLVLVDHSKVINGEPNKFDAVEWFRLDALPSPLHSQFPLFLSQYGEKLNIE